jgi:hypothetical protein
MYLAAYCSVICVSHTEITTWQLICLDGLSKVGRGPLFASFDAILMFVSKIYVESTINANYRLI